jgi:transposase-like protein
MNYIIRFLLLYIQYLHKQINELLFFIAKFIPIKQWMFDDAHSPKYQKFKTDILPTIIKFHKQDYRFLIEYYRYKYHYTVKPIKRQNGSSVDSKVKCPRCSAPHQYLYNNNGKGGQYLCKVCNERFNIHNYVKNISLKCPHCAHHLQHKKDRKHYRIHKCVNKKCPYYLNRLKKLSTEDDKTKYKLHYIYREFTIDFFDFDLKKLPQWFTGFKYKRKSAYIMSLCLTYHVNLGLSLRKTAHALKEIHEVDISHTMVANYARTAAVVIKPFIDNYDYQPSNELTADETYIKVKGVKHYVWFIMDKISRSIIGYQVSNNRGVGPCILAMRMAFDKFKDFPKRLKFVADGYSAYPLAAQQFQLKEGKHFNITQVIGLTNDDEVSTKHRPDKQIIERLNRTFKASYRVTCGYENISGADLGLTLWTAYYNFLRPHHLYQWKRPLNLVEEFSNASNMPAKWQLLILLGQQELLKSQENTS